MERVPVEIWQQIILNVVETGDGPMFMTSCTPHTFLYLVNQQTRIRDYRKPYSDYLERCRRLRLVCRAWNEFVLLSRHRWLQLDDKWSPVYDLDSTTSSAGGVRPVERLSMTINSEELVVPILSWTSHPAPCRSVTPAILRSTPLKDAHTMVQSFRRSRWTNTRITRIHQHGAPVTVHRDGMLDSVHIPPAALLHIHWAPLSLPDQRDRHAFHVPDEAGICVASGPPRGLLGRIPCTALAWRLGGYHRAAGLGRKDRRPAHNPSLAVPRVLVAVARRGYGRSCTAEVDLS